MSCRSFGSGKECKLVRYEKGQWIDSKYTEICFQLLYSALKMFDIDCERKTVERIISLDSIKILLTDKLEWGFGAALWKPAFLDKFNWSFDSFTIRWMACQSRWLTEAVPWKHRGWQIKMRHAGDLKNNIVIMRKSRSHRSKYVLSLRLSHMKICFFCSIDAFPKRMQAVLGSSIDYQNIPVQGCCMFMMIFWSQNCHLMI